MVLVLASSSTSEVCTLSGSAWEGAGSLGTPMTFRTISGHHRSSSGTLRIVRHRTASPFCLMTKCSPVRAICPTNIPRIDLGASLRFCCFFLPCPVLLAVNFAKTISPNSTSGLTHLRPVSRSWGVIPSCPMENFEIK